MGASQSREGLELSDSDREDENEVTNEEEEEKYVDVEEEHQRSSERRPKTPSSVDEVEAKLRALKLKYGSSQKPTLKNAVKLACCCWNWGSTCCICYSQVCTRITLFNSRITNLRLAWFTCLF